MSIVRSLIVVLVAAFAVPAFAGEAADANLDILRETLRANKKAIVATSLTLTDAEAAQFWPLYDRYQAELTGVNDRLVKLIEDYTASFKTLTDEKAETLIEEYLDIDEDRAKIRRTHLPRFKKVLSGKKVARFYQIENKIDVILRYDLAEEIPVVEE